MGIERVIGIGSKAAKLVRAVRESENWIHGLDGKVVLEKKGMKPTSLALDPKTGNVWVLTSEETI